MTAVSLARVDFRGRARQFGAETGHSSPLWIEGGLIDTDEIGTFMAGALRLTAGAGIEKCGRDEVA